MNHAEDIDHDDLDTPWSLRAAIKDAPSLRLVEQTSQAEIERRSAELVEHEPRRIPRPVVGQPYMVARFGFWPGFSDEVVAEATDETRDLTWWAERHLSSRVEVYRSTAPWGVQTPQEQAAAARGEHVGRLELVGEIRDGRIWLVREVLAPRVWLDLGGHLVRAALAEDGSYRAHPDDAVRAVIGMSDALHGAARTDRELDARIRAVRDGR